MVSIINFGPLYNDPEQGRQWWRGAVAVVTVLITSHIVRIMTRTSHTATPPTREIGEFFHQNSMNIMEIIFISRDCNFLSSHPDDMMS